MNGTLLIVDDNSENLASLTFAFSRSSYRVLTAGGGQEAIAAIRGEQPDVVVTDLKMPDADGMEVLRRALGNEPPPAVILLTAHATVESAVEALREGAFHYLTKPVNLKELRAQVEKAMEMKRLERENVRLHSELDDKFGFEGVVGETPAMHELIKKVRMIASARTTVLIEGESGTGKELIAQAVHYNSPRKRRPFIPVHCAAMSESLIESELFGHEKGAFTGALGLRKGRFELSDGGTLFLDEVGEIPLSIQVKLLRVLETLEFRRVGGAEPVKVDVRLVVATNRDLSKEVAEGRFREDLFYRLNVVRLHLPPLRERLSDIPLLVRLFAERISEENGRKPPRVSPEVLARLSSHDWPGNIRELRNVVENMIVFLEGDTLEAGHLPSQFLDAASAASKTRNSIHLGQTLQEAEECLIRQTLDSHGGNRTKAAAALGISRRTLQRKLKEQPLDE
jgi:DNA-binding NtrC family response regulator